MTQPTKSALEVLAERCEQAAGPDRELDGRIHVAVVLHKEWNEQMQRACIKADEWNDTSDIVAHYSASLDAAMTLVPEGWSVENGGWHNLSQPSAGFSLWQYEKDASGNWMHGSEHSIVRGNAATPALALCAAALRARAR